MAKNLEISMLLDFYGEMLTDKQREVVSLYYNEDLSLAEIASIAQITRQGVRDSIKRGEATLIDMEERLKLAAKFRQMEEDLTNQYWWSVLVNGESAVTGAEQIVLEDGVTYSFVLMQGW